MLFLYDPLVGAVAAALALPVMILNRRLMARSEGLYRELNDLAEVEVVATGLWVFTIVRVTSATIDIGAIFAMIAYVAFYTAGFDDAPGVLRRLTRLRDIKQRLDDEVSPPIDPAGEP